MPLRNMLWNACAVILGIVIAALFLHGDDDTRDTRASRVRHA